MTYLEHFCSRHDQDLFPSKELKRVFEHSLKEPHFKNSLGVTNGILPKYNNNHIRKQSHEEMLVKTPKQDFISESAKIGNDYLNHDGDMYPAAIETKSLSSDGSVNPTSAVASGLAYSFANFKNGGNILDQSIDMTRTKRSQLLRDELNRV